MAEVTLIYLLCRREYSINVKAMDNYYDEPMRLGWMNGVIIGTLALAFLNLLQYHIPVVGVPLRVANSVFYIYFFIRIIDYVSVFMSVEKATVAEARNTAVESSLTDCAWKSPPYYPDSMEQTVAAWVKSGQFCTENITISDVARQMNTNRKYLSAYLNHGLGITFSLWLNTLRIEQAKTFFDKYPEKNITEIGMSVGISEVYNFSRWFKTVAGVSPHKYLRNCGK